MYCFLKIRTRCSNVRRHCRLTAISLALVIITTAVPAGGKIHPATYELGWRDNGYIHAWVFFSHKPRDLARSTAAHRASEKALERRGLRGNVTEEQASDLDRAVYPGFLQQVQNNGAAIRQVSRWLNAVSVSATRKQLESLAQLSFVSRIEPVRRMVRPPLPAVTPFDGSPTMMKSPAHQLDYGPSYNQLDLMNVPAVHDLGYSGQGITVLMLDTGFYKDHESIHPERILAEYDFLNNDGETQNETKEEDQAGQHNHGTHTYTALGGYSPGRLIGPAYECRYLLAKTESNAFENITEEDNYVAGLEWGEALGADIVSSSLGYLDWYVYDDMNGLTAVTTRAVLWATRLGMLVVTAAGNERHNSVWGGYIIAPADADSIITVGAVDAKGELAGFSGHGPTSDGRTKPEVVAQGVGVHCGSTGTDAYTTASGTSLSTPLVAGCAALLLEAHPTWTPDDVRKAFMATASHADSPDNDYGWGIPDLLGATKYDPGSPSPEPTFAITRVFPNPYSPSSHRNLEIQWPPEIRKIVRVDIYDILGRYVATGKSQRPGQYAIIWNGKDFYGRQAASGIYLIKASTGSAVNVKRVIILR